VTVAVLGAGIVGTAAAWDLTRRGHDVTVTDVIEDAARAAASIAGCRSKVLDATDPDRLKPLLADSAAVVSAIPYHHGLVTASAAVETGTHYVDFGGNPTVVAAQLKLDDAARRAGIAVVPDCGLAPGMTNVLAMGVIERLGDGPVRELRLRVGALPTEPRGALKYQLAFNPAGLINEYAEPCEVLRSGRYDTVEPLTEIEEIAWERWGPLEAFHTAGGSSSLPRRFEGRVADLDYKTLRYPGHCAPFRALYEMGLFDETPQPGSGIAPRTVLLEALAANLPQGGDDLVLVRTWGSADRGGSEALAGYQVEDRNDDLFSALARTTAFPATALVDLLLTGDLPFRGADTMDGAIAAEPMIAALEETGIRIESF
jgi:lysine 6-dehydrogenase